MLVLNMPAFGNKKYTAYDRFHGNGPYGEILTKKEPSVYLRYTATVLLVNFFCLATFSLPLSSWFI